MFLVYLFHKFLCSYQVFEDQPTPKNDDFRSAYLIILKDRRWGILWRPMEFGLGRVVEVVNSVVRMHNFCWDRQVSVPKHNVGKITVPTEVAFNSRGQIDNDYFRPASTRPGRPHEDQVVLSKPREDIRRELEIRGFVRPAHNLARNRNR